MPRPPRKRREVYEFICRYKEENDGNTPTYQEISKHFGWISLNNAWVHVEGLARDGFVSFDERRRIIVNGTYISPIT